MLQRALLGVLGLLLVLPAFGQPERPKLEGELTLEQAVQYSLAHHLAVAVSQAEARAAKARTSEAEAAFRPKLSLGVYLNAGDTDMIVSGVSGVEPGFWTNLPGGGLSTNLSLMLPLYTGGRLQARLAQAEAGERTALARLALTMRQKARDVRKAFFELLQARSGLDAAAWDLAQQEEVLRVSRERQAVGRVAPYVVLRVEAEVASARQKVNESGAELEMATVTLKNAMGVAPKSDFTLTAPAPETLPEGELEELVSTAVAERPDLAVARYALEAADERVAEVLSEYSPQLALYAMAEAKQPELAGPAPFDGGYQVGLVLSWPLYDGGERGARREEAEAMRDARQLELRQMEYDVAAEVERERARWKAARANEELAGAEVVAAEEELRIARMRFDLGRGLHLEVLDALATLRRARNNQIQAAYRRGLAESDFLYATGRY
ncbi:TolC family protein [bacterium CPR1]|nr:TolC family protein [bacterium CPR1]